MSRFEWPDLSCLVSLAGDQKVDVRPVLLRVHTDLFVAAPSRDRATVVAFEALALGFLPIVDEVTAAIVAHKLAPIADTPQSIVDALIRCGGEARSAILGQGSILNKGAVLDKATSTPHEAPLPSLAPPAETRDLHPLVDNAGEDQDLAVARNRHAHLGTLQLRDLVERGRERPQLAMELLHRRELGVADEAVLYLHADDTRRAQIRSRLEPMAALAGRSPFRSRPNRAAVEALLGFALALDVQAFEAELARMLHLAPVPAWRFQVEARRELLALALVAAGVAPEDCIRVFLTLHPVISRSVSTVFHLAHVARSVPQPVALYLVEAVLDVVVEAKPEGRYVPASQPAAPPSRKRARRPTVAQIRAAVLARRAG